MTAQLRPTPVALDAYTAAKASGAPDNAAWWDAYAASPTHWHAIAQADATAAESAYYHPSACTCAMTPGDRYNGMPPEPVGPLCAWCQQRQTDDDRAAELDAAHVATLDLVDDDTDLPF